MNNRSKSFNDGNGWTVNPHVPAIIPPHGEPAAVLAGQRLLFIVPYEPYGRTVLMAAVFAFIASATGFLTAALWPWEHRDKTGPVATALLPSLARDSLAADNPARDNLARDKEASNAGDSADRSSNVTNLADTPSDGIDLDVCRVNSSAPQLVANTPPTVVSVDQPASLGLKVDGALEGAQLVICGLAAKFALSAGQSVDEKTWMLPASQIANATIIPPPGFVGPMKLAVALVNTDKSLADRRTLDLEWSPQAPPAPSPTMPQVVDDPDLNKLLEQGIRLKAAGNFAEARLILGRIAQAGDSRAAFMLAETYDPIALAKRQLLPANSDMELARIWYRKATALGAPEAAGRIERLATW